MILFVKIYLFNNYSYNFNKSYYIYYYIEIENLTNSSPVSKYADVISHSVPTVYKSVGWRQEGHQTSK